MPYLVDALAIFADGLQDPSHLDLGQGTQVVSCLLHQRSAVSFSEVPQVVETDL